MASVNVTDTIRWGGCLNGSRFENGTLVPMPAGSEMEKAYIMMWKIITPFIIIFGGIGNALTIAVLLRSTRRMTSTVMYLLILAISDTVFLLNGPLRQWIRMTWDWDLRNSHTIVCKLSAYLTYSTYHFSAWLLVAVTLERVLSVIWPHKVKNKCTRSVSYCVILAVFLATFLLDSHILYGVHVKTTVGYGQKSACYYIDRDYKYFFENIWNLVDMIVSLLLPFSILAIGNGVIVKELYHTQKDRRKLSAYATGQNRDRSSTRSVMITLLLLSSVFFLSQTPTLYFIYYPYLKRTTNQLGCKDYRKYIQQTDLTWFIYTLTRLISYLNAMLNFFMYVISGRKFRTELILLLRCQPAGINASKASFKTSQTTLRTSCTTINKQEDALVDDSSL